jgi:cytochrome P450
MVTIQSFLFAMTLYPAAQRKAQEELDRVVKDRLPTAADQEDLPYTMAVALETLRWALHTTIGLWHVTAVTQRLIRPVQGYLIDSWRMIFTKDISYQPALPCILTFGLYERSSLPTFLMIIAFIIRAISHDPATYPNPDDFDPDRFYLRNEMDPREYAFGFGRRACPGSHLAMQGFFVAASSLLWSFNIKSRKDLDTFDLRPQNLFDFMVFK